ncbi:MAG: CRISPR-associated endonuclease Cas1 [Candidatus Omnitrophota bacterium]|nr:CRISPR-associated endonuclease Cas1 [Candidatus Omnitrophota bacterium]
MSDVPLPTQSNLESQPPLPIRRLHNFLYCPRLFYYQWVENIFQENADTVEGSRVHRNVDKPSRLENVKELELPEGSSIRSLRLESETLGLVGMVDIIEGGSEGAILVDYKKGSARRDEQGERVAKEPDAMQVIAQAMLLREHGIQVKEAFVYYAAEKRRVPVDISEERMQECRAKILEAKAVAASGQCPPPLKDDPRCLYCSAYPICLPGESGFWQVSREESVDIKRAPRPENDEGEVLVVQTPGAQVGLRGGQIIVSVKEEVIRKLPSRQVRAVYLYGAVQVTAQAAQDFLEHDVDVSFFAPSGRFLGLLRGLPASGVDARRGQYRLFEQPVVCLKMAREMIRAKIHNQRVMLMRNSEPPQRVLDQIGELRDKAAEAENVEGLLGLEGMAAALYFEHFGRMFKADEKLTFDFSSRNRRPPRDPVNAILSLGYSMLCKELTGICHTVGLDPFLGVMHQPRYGRPALALDLMEEFRPLIVDSVAVSLVNRGEVTGDDFVMSASGVFLNDRGRRAFWESYSRRMDTEVSHPQFGYKMTYRRMLEVQARQMWRFVRGEAGGYVGFTTR